MPKTIETTVYTYSELSDKAKEKAREWYLGIGHEFFWSDEWRDSLKAAEQAFPIKVMDWEVDTYSSNYRMKWTGSDHEEELSGVRLRTYLLNNYYHIFYTRKHYGEYRKNEQTGKYRYQRYSKCQWERTSCPWTGYCGDESFMDKLWEFIEKPNPSTTFKELMDDCCSHFFTHWQKDCEFQVSEEYIADHLEANGYEFTVDGKRF